MEYLHTFLLNYFRLSTVAIAVALLLISKRRSKAHGLLIASCLLVFTFLVSVAPDILRRIIDNFVSYDAKWNMEYHPYWQVVTGIDVYVRHPTVALLFYGLYQAGRRHSSISTTHLASALVVVLLSFLLMQFGPRPEIRDGVIKYTFFTRLTTLLGQLAMLSMLVIKVVFIRSLYLDYKKAEYDQQDTSLYRRGARAIRTIKIAWLVNLCSLPFAAVSGWLFIRSNFNDPGFSYPLTMLSIALSCVILVTLKNLFQFKEVSKLALFCIIGHVLALAVTLVAEWYLSGFKSSGYNIDDVMTALQVLRYGYFLAFVNSILIIIILQRLNARMGRDETTVVGWLLRWQGIAVFIWLLMAIAGLNVYLLYICLLPIVAGGVYFVVQFFRLFHRTEQGLWFYNDAK